MVICGERFPGRVNNICKVSEVRTHGLRKRGYSRMMGMGETANEVREVSGSQLRIPFAAQNKNFCF